MPVTSSNNIEKTNQGKEKTVLRTIGLSGTINGGAEGAVDVRNGKILRIRPLHYDWKFDKANLNPWKFEKNGKTLEPNWKSLPGTFLWPTRSGSILPTGLNTR